MSCNRKVVRAVVLVGVAWLGWISISIAATGTIVDYTYDAVGNIIAIQRTSTALTFGTFTPNSGPSGETVIVKGSGFDPNPNANLVRFNGSLATVTSANRAQLTVVVPQAATTGPISVTVGSNTVTSATAFTVTQSYGVPVIAGFTPTCGLVGQAINVSGSNFDPTAGATSVALGTAPASTTVTESDALSFAVPAGASSAHISVTTASGTGTSSSPVLVPPPGFSCADFAYSTVFMVAGGTSALTIPAGRKGAVMFDGVASAWMSLLASGATTQPANSLLNYSIYDGSTVIATGSVSGPAFSILAPPLPHTGTYLLVVTPASGASASLGLNLQIDSDLVADGASIATGNIAPGQTKRVRFAGSSGQFLGLGAIGVGSPLSVRYLNPDGSSLATASWSSDSSDDLPVLTATGSHALLLTATGTSPTNPTLLLSSDLVGTLAIGGPAQTFQTARAGQNGRFTFSATAGTTASMRISSNAFSSVDVQVRRPDGSIHTSSTITSSSLEVAIPQFPNSGMYTVFVSGTATNRGSLQLAVGNPDLTISSMNPGTPVARQDGGFDFVVSFTVTNSGMTTAVAPWYDLAYLSVDGVLDDLDLNLSGVYQQTTALAPSASYAMTTTFSTPANFATGNYTLFLKTDGHGATNSSGNNTDAGSVNELNESNNTQSVGVTLGRPDLTVISASAGTVIANADGSFSIPLTYAIQNVGTVAAPAGWFDAAYLSIDAALDDTDQRLAGAVQRTSALAAGAAYNVTATYTTSATTAAGTYIVFVKADGRYLGGSGSNTDTGTLLEANETNNTRTVSVTLIRPDLTVTAASAGTVIANQNGSFTIPVTYTVKNVGTVAAQPGWWDVAYLSANTTLEDSDQSLSGATQHSSALAAAGTYSATTNYITTPSTVTGTYTLFVKADGRGSSIGTGTNTDSGSLAEADETNNTKTVSVTLARPDLSVTAASAGTVIANHDGSFTIPITYTVKNVGTATAQPNWNDLAYLSADATLQDTDQNLSGINQHTTALAASGTYSVTVNFTTSTSTSPGTYTLFIKTDAHGSTIGPGSNTDGGDMVEVSEANNTKSMTVILAKPDLTVTAASVGTIVANQNGSFGIPVTYTVKNIGTIAAQPNWYDGVYLSANATLEDGDQNLSGAVQRTTALSTNGTYSVTATFTTTTSTAPGTYTLFVKADGHGSAIGTGANTDSGSVSEANEANNTQSVPLTLALPDLTVTVATVGTITKNANNSYNVPITYTVKNAGTIAAQPNWYDLAYLSVDASLDDGDQNLSGSNQHTIALAANGTYSVTKTFVTSTTTASGTYTVFVKTDARGSTVGNGSNTDAGSVVEASEINNTKSILITLP